MGFFTQVSYSKLLVSNTVWLLPNCAAANVRGWVLYFVRRCWEMANVIKFLMEHCWSGVLQAPAFKELVPSLPDGLNEAYNSVSDACGNLISLNAFSGRISWISLQGYLDYGGWWWSCGWEFKEVLANPISSWLVKFFHLKPSVWCLP